MLNRAVLVGRLTKDPELRSAPNGVNVGIHIGSKQNIHECSRRA